MTNELDIKNSLLSQLRSGEITMEEFDKECSYWLIHCNIEHFVDPIKPQDMLDYEALEPKDRLKIPSSFWRKGEVKSYMDKLDHVRAHNHGMLQSLIRFRGYIPSGDEHTLKLFDEKIALFRTAIPNGVRKVQDFFGGKVEKV